MLFPPPNPYKRRTRFLVNDIIKIIWIILIKPFRKQVEMFFLNGWFTISKNIDQNKRWLREDCWVLQSLCTDYLKYRERVYKIFALFLAVWAFLDCNVGNIHLLVWLLQKFVFLPLIRSQNNALFHGFPKGPFEYCVAHY